MTALSAVACEWGGIPYETRADDLLNHYFQLEFQKFDLTCLL